MNETINGTAFRGYRRENGRIGIRNHVAIIPLDSISNKAAQGVAKIVHGTVALTHPYGDLQFGRDLELFFRTMTGYGTNPNVAAAVVIGAEPDWTDRLAEGIAQTGKPVEAFTIEQHGDLNTIERAARKAAEFVRYATGLQRQQADLSEIVVGIKCSESDPTSGLAANPTLGKAVERLLAAGATVVFGETSELTGAGAHRCRAHQVPGAAGKILAVLQRIRGFCRQGEGPPARFSAQPGKHSGRLEHH